MRMWREPTPRDDPKWLQLASLERAVFYSLVSAREPGAGKGCEGRRGEDLDTVIAEESKVIGPQIGNIKPGGTGGGHAAAPAPKKPFINENTELMKPGNWPGTVP